MQFTTCAFGTKSHTTLIGTQSTCDEFFLEIQQEVRESAFTYAHAKPNFETQYLSYPGQSDAIDSLRNEHIYRTLHKNRNDDVVVALGRLLQQLRFDSRRSSPYFRHEHMRYAV